ncbi:MAG TPA: hypothetical protein VFZ86_06200, partial [Thermoleophilia bacterium]|nr:hypothetical protein [Thermoleophilia bacterium]
MAAAALLAACGGQTAAPADQASRGPSPAGSSPTAGAAPRPAVIISDRAGPSWKGRLGETVQIDWYDQRRDEMQSEQ